MNKSAVTVGILVCCISTSLAIPACAPAPPAALTPVTLQLLWTHNAEFAGFYAADQKGYYAAEGLRVTFREGGPTVDYLGAVADGTAQFGDAGADELLLARANGVSLRAIATVYRRSPLVFIALADSGIKRPHDFVAQTIRVTPRTEATLHAMLARTGVRPDQVTEVNLPSDVAAFASGQAPVWSSYLTDFSITLQQAGYRLNTVFPDDYGIHFYADSIFTTDDLIATRSDLVRRFLRATLKGWTYAVEHPSEVGALVAGYAPGADVALENTKFLAAIPLVNTGEDDIGWMKPAVWAGMQAVLRAQGVLTQTLDNSQAYTLDYVREIYAR